MNYIEFAENERLSTIVLGMMRISQMSEDEVEALVEAALSIGINTFDLADIYGDGQGTCNGDSLLFPTRQFTRILIQLTAKPQIFDDLQKIMIVCEISSHLTILSDRQIR